METLISIDPGRQKLGWASFVNGRLKRCGLSRIPKGDYEKLSLGEVAMRHCGYVLNQTLLDGRPDIVLVEQMRYQPGRTKGTKGANALIDLGYIGGAVAGVLSPTVAGYFPTPKEWKGDVPKGVQHARDWKVLDPWERQVLSGALSGVGVIPGNDIKDAVGIGLFGVRKAGHR